MAPPPSPLQLSEEQVLYFRARRGHLAGPGAANVETAARDMLGAQAQQIAPALLALSQRTHGRPSAKRVHQLLADDGRTLVRERWSPGGRRGAMPPTATVNKVRKRMEAAQEAWTRANLKGLIPAGFLNTVAEHLVANRMPAEQAFRFAAGRVLWCLALNGDACLSHKIGAEQTYIPRTHWFPDLPWPDPAKGKAAEQQVFDIGVKMTRRYLALYGPATPQDVAHFFCR